MKVQVYIKHSKELFQKALEEFEKGDLIQSSEKAWEACASVVKAFAEKHGLEHYRHTELEEIMSNLISETRDKELLDEWGVCLRIHANFYEGFMKKEDIKLSLEEVKRFLIKWKK